MNHISNALFFMLALVAGRAVAAPDAAAASAELAAKHVAIASAALAAFEKGLNATASVRVAHINSVRTLAYNGQTETEREIAILRETDGTDIIKMFEALVAHGDKAALASSQAEAAEAATKAELGAAFSPLSISTEKLDRAALTLAGLAKQQTSEERAAFLIQFFKDTRTETKKLLDDSKKARDEAEAKLDATSAAAATSVAAAISK